MLKSMLFAALTLAAAPALAQPGQGQPAPAQPPASPPSEGPTPPPEFIQAAQAFGQCLRTGGGQVAASVTPQAGAAQILAGCAQQRAALEGRFETWVSGPNFPEAGRAIAREQMRSQLAQLEGSLAAQIAQRRAAPAPAPQPSQTPNN